MELEAKIADSGVWARLYFLRKFLFSDFFYFSRNRDRKIKTCELNNQNGGHDAGQVGFWPIGSIRSRPMRSGARINGKHQKWTFQIESFSAKKELVKNIVENDARSWPLTMFRELSSSFSRDFEGFLTKWSFCKETFKIPTECQLRAHRSRSSGNIFH